jgi:hypothetical protein
MMQAYRKIIDVHDAQVLIELPPSFVNHHVEFIVLTLDEDPAEEPARRKPSPAIAGKGKTLGDAIAPIGDAEDRSEVP